MYADSSVHVDRGEMFPFSCTAPSSNDDGGEAKSAFRRKRTTSITVRSSKCSIDFLSVPLEVEGGEEALD